MEVAPKKMKISLDPLNELHSDVHDLIFQHLRGRDVRNLFMVSKKWSQMTGNSTAAMDKIYLNLWEIKYDKPSGADVTLLLRSQRKYLNMTASLRYASNFHRKLALLTQLLPSLVELTVHGCESLQAIQLIEKHFSVNLSLPNLKSLDTLNNNSSLFLRILEKADNLECLSLNNYYGNESIAEILCSKKKLKTLTVFDDFGKSLLSSMISQSLPIKFKLTSLKVNQFFDFRDSDLKFILMMSETLEDLDVASLNLGLAKLLHNLPKLKRLIFEESDFNLPVDAVEAFKPNTSIEHLEFSDLFSSIPDNLLTSLKGVRIISTDDMDADDLTQLLKFIPGLEKVELEDDSSFKWEEFEEVYKKVRKQFPSNIRAVEFKKGNTSRIVLHP